MATHSHSHADLPAHVHAHAPRDFGRAFAIGIALNLGFVAVETVYGFLASSMALLADAGHNLSDVLGLVVAWAAAVMAKRAASPRFTYGLKKAPILAALANSLILLVAIGAIGAEAIRRLLHPSASDGRTIMIVAGVGILVNAATALLFARGREHDINIAGAYLHMAADAAVSAGVVAAAALTAWLGWIWLDPAASLAIAVVILIGTWGLFSDSLHLMFDGVPTSIDLDAVRAELGALPGVSCVSDLHVWATGTTQVALTAHLVTPAGAPDDAFYRAAAARLQERFAIGHVTLQATTETLMTPCDGVVATPPAPAREEAVSAS
jgi:cobalt-zinc-cadmium efflux system protein